MSNTDIEYYRALYILERLEEERKKKKIPAAQLSKRMGKCPAYWSVKYDQAHIPRIRTVYEAAKTLGVSLEYIIYGYEYGPFENIKIDIKKIPEYTSGKRLYLNSSQKSIVSKIRKGGQTDIGMDMFLGIEEKIQKNLLKIITIS